jgi:hypothetical protein
MVGLQTGALSDFLAAINGSNLGGRNTAPALMDRQVVNRLKAMTRFPENSSGSLTSGGSTANTVRPIVAPNALVGVDLSAYHTSFGAAAGAFSCRPRACLASTAKLFCSHSRTEPASGASASSGKPMTWRTSTRPSRTKDRKVHRLCDRNYLAGDTIGFHRIAKRYDKIAKCHQSTILLGAIPIAINLSTWPQTLPQPARLPNAFRPYIEKPRPPTDTSLSLHWPFSRPLSPSRPPRRS